MKKEEETFAIRTYGQGGTGVALLHRTRTRSRPAEPLSMDTAYPPPDGRTQCHRLQQIPPLLPETGGGNHVKYLGEP